MIEMCVNGVGFSMKEGQIVLDGEQSGRPTDKNEDDTNNKLIRKFTKTGASLLTSFMRNFREFQGL